MLSYLRKSFKNGAKKIDRWVLISEQKIPVRLVVFKRAEEEYQLKRQQRKKDRHKRTAHDDDYYEQLRYCVYITNVDSDIAPAETIRSLYRLRWRIEILYKCWKSHLHLDKIFKNISTPNPAVNWMLLYLILLKVVMYHQEIIQKMICHLDKFDPTTHKISILKMYNILATHGNELARSENSDFVLKFISYFATYSKDKRRTTHYEKINMLNFNSS